MIQKETYLRALDIVRRYKDQCETELKEVSENTMLMVNPDYTLEQIKKKEILDARSVNGIVRYFLDQEPPKWDTDYQVLKEITVKDLSNIDLTEIRSCRNFGDKSIRKIKEFLYVNGLM